MYLFTKHQISIFLVLSFFWGTCNSFNPEAACPVLSEIDFLSLKEGKSWTYEYADGSRIIPASGERRIYGTLTLKVEGISECQDEGRVVSLTESIEGEFQEWIHTDAEEHKGWQFRGPHFSKRPLQFIIGEDALLDHYSLEPILYALFQEDELELTIEQSEWEDERFRTSIQLQFERGTGLVSWSRREDRHRDLYYRELTLIRDQNKE